MQSMTLREVVNEWWAFKGTGPITPQVLAELEKAEAAVDLADLSIGDTEPSIETRESVLSECQLSCRYWDAKQAAAKFRTNQ